MRQGPLFRLTAIVTLACLTFSCMPTRIPPISSEGAAFRPANDERRLWEQAREEERKLRDQARIYQDPLLVDYLEEIVRGLNPPGMADNPEIGYRVTVIEEPTLNAFAYPHGSLFVHTGLLARMENEDQLATVLGHEMTHVENRHMLRYQRSVRNKQIGFAVAAIAAAVVLAREEGEALEKGNYSRAATVDLLGNLLVSLGLTLAILASMNGYGRDLEREADEGAFAKLTGAGYDLRESPRVYEILQDDHGEPGKFETFFFGSHPKLATRIESANGWLAEHPDLPPATRTRDTERFRQRLRPVIRDDAALNIEAGRLRLAEDELERVVAMMPEDPETHLLLGRLYLEKGEPDRAAASLREAIRLDPERPAPHRELGLLAYRQEDFKTACVQFRQYVELDPRAEDAPRIRDYLLELERDGHCD